MKTILSTFAAFLALVSQMVTHAQAPATPGPEHAMLKKLEGNWTVKTKIGDEESIGKAAYKMELGGLWLTSTFEGEMMGTKFEGRGFDSYDASSNKYRAVWIDNFSAKPFVLEGTYDKEKKALTMTGETPDGQKVKTVTTFKSDDSMTFEMFAVTGGGQEKIMSSEYTRKK